MPTSACRRAGASLTPSPVTATTWPRCCRDSTSSSFSAGVTRAWISSSARPSRRPIARAVSSWSPVSIRTSRSSSRAVSSDASAPGRSGSARATRPSGSRSRSSSSSDASAPAIARSAIASTRAPSRARSAARPASRSSSRASPRQRASTTSGAPLTTARSSPSRRTSTVARLRAASKGRERRTVPGSSTPCSPAARTSAASTGSICAYDDASAPASSSS